MAPLPITVRSLTCYADSLLVDPRQFAAAHLWSTLESNQDQAGDAQRGDDAGSGSCGRRASPHSATHSTSGTIPARSRWLESRIKLAVEDAYIAFTHPNAEGLIEAERLRYPNLDLRQVDLLEPRGLDRSVIAQLAMCRFTRPAHDRHVLGFTGSRKSYIGSALAIYSAPTTPSRAMHAGTFCVTTRNLDLIRVL